MAARPRWKAAVGDAALERSCCCVDGGLWGRERRAFADCCGSRSPGVYTDRYTCDVTALHRGSDCYVHTGAYFYAYAGAHTRSHPDACSYTNSDAHAYANT